MSKPKVEYGYDFKGTPIGSVTFDLNADDVSEQIKEFFEKHPDITLSVSDRDESED